jgi:flagellar biosynthesis/type III secretory pathway chaperone
MEATQEKSYTKLVHNLEELVKHYRSLLDLIRKEKELLIAADIEKLNESNLTKETMLYKIRSLDTARERYAKEVALAVGAAAEQPRLLEIARRCTSQEGDKLRAIHSTLEMLLGRISSLNKENETYAQSALRTLNGALNEVKDTLSGKKTYGQKGKMATGPERAGNFVSKEA